MELVESIAGSISKVILAKNLGANPEKAHIFNRNKIYKVAINHAEISTWSGRSLSVSRTGAQRTLFVIKTMISFLHLEKSHYEAKIPSLRSCRELYS